MRRRGLKLAALLLVMLLLVTGCGQKKDTIKATVSIDCLMAIEGDFDAAKAVAEDGLILTDYEVELEKDATAYDALQKACDENNLPLVVDGAGDTAFVTGIGGLMAGDCGEQSCWMYFINDKGAEVGVGAYTVEAGDKLGFRYSLDWGADVGAF